MLFEEFSKWRFEVKNPYFACDGNDEDAFYQFFNERSEKFDSLADIITDLAYQIYELQTCMEGMLEDQA